MVGVLTNSLYVPDLGGVVSWVGDLTISTMLKMPNGGETSFGSIVTLSNGDAWDWFEKVEKHLLGQHDQSTHGHGHSKTSMSVHTPDPNLYDRFRDSRDAYLQSAKTLTYPDGKSIWNTASGQDAIEGSWERYLFNSSPIDKWDKEFNTLDKNITSFVKNNPVSVYIDPDAFTNVLAEGAFQTIHENPDSKGNFYYNHRESYEHVAFGYSNWTHNVEDRPVYGVFEPKSLHLNLSTALNYGAVKVVLKDSVKARTTFTIGDSLDSFAKPMRIGDKVPRNFTNSQMAVKTHDFQKLDMNIFNEPFWHNTNYVEAQVHGGVKLEDIQKVVFSSGSQNKVNTSVLDNLGIPWEVSN